MKGSKLLVDLVLVANFMNETKLSEYVTHKDK